MARETQADTEAIIRAAMQQLLGGDIPDGLKCDVKSLCVLAGTPRATLYRSYPHLKAGFDRQRGDAQEAGQQPDPRLAQIERLKRQAVDLHARIARANAQLAELQTFRGTALSRLAAQHDELTALRRELNTPPSANVRGLRPR